MVLLLPGTVGTDAPVVGPIQADAAVTAGTPVAFAASFTDRNSGDRHSATWAWNDGCGGAAVSKVRGPGTMRTSHTFCAPGEYWITLTVTDSSGRSTTVGRYLMVDDPAPAGPALAGSGWFPSPRGAYRQQPMHSGPAQFGVLAGTASGRKGLLRFHVAKLSFASVAYDTLSVAGGRAQYRGSGTLNGAGNYRFALEAVGAAASRGRLRMKIWHVDPRSKAAVVDYDNQDTAAAAIAGDGSTVAGGSIVVHP